jgi:pyruvate-formate lyase
VVINNSANVLLGRHVGASADGRQAGAPLTNGHTATNGMDQNGITALLNSMTKLDSSCHAGATHNLKLSPQMFTRYRPQLEAFLATYFAQGGTQAMLTVVSRDDLLRALKSPEQYRHILVRVGGFSARFVDLPPDVQQDILSRTLWT